MLKEQMKVRIDPGSLKCLKTILCDPLETRRPQANSHDIPFLAHPLNFSILCLYLLQFPNQGLNLGPGTKRAES